MPLPSKNEPSWETGRKWLAGLNSVSNEKDPCLKHHTKFQVDVSYDWWEKCNEKYWLWTYWLTDWMVFYATFNSISVISRPQFTLFMLSWVSPVLGWCPEVSCPRTLPRKIPEDPVRFEQDPWITSQTLYQWATWDPPMDLWMEWWTKGQTDKGKTLYPSLLRSQGKMKIFVLVG